MAHMLGLRIIGSGSGTWRSIRILNGVDAYSGVHFFKALCPAVSMDAKGQRAR